MTGAPGSKGVQYREAWTVYSQSVHSGALRRWEGQERPQGGVGPELEASRRKGRDEAVTGSAGLPGIQPGVSLL